MMSPTLLTKWDDWELMPPARAVPLDELPHALDPHIREVAMHYNANQGLTELLYLAGCGQAFDQSLFETFFLRLQSYRKMYSGPYMALHVRRGDKATEGRIFNLDETMAMARMYAPDSKQVFIATDDANVVEGAGLTPFEHSGFIFRWNRMSRMQGGEVNTMDSQHVAHHDSKTEAVQAVLDDTMALASADKLIGSWNSKFFRLAWLLNYLRRTAEERQESWCYDIFSGQDCSDRAAFAIDFCRKVLSMGVQYDGFCPGDLASQLAECMM